LEITDKTFTMSYEIRNNSEKDIWVLAGIGRFDVGASSFLDEDTRTIVLTNRFDFPGITFGRNAIYARYTRLRAGQTQTESVLFALPVRLMRGTVPEGQHASSYATRLAIEISCYVGDLPGTVRDKLLEAEKPKSARSQYDAPLISGGFGGLLGFTKMNEGLRDRNEETVIPYSEQLLPSEQILRIAVDALRFAYQEEDLATLSSPPAPPDLTSCQRVEIRYEPSMLDFLFPYGSQRALMSPAEIESLQSQPSIVVEDAETLKNLAHEVGKALCTSGIVRQRNAVHMTCYRDSGPSMSFHIYNNDSVVTEEGNRFANWRGFGSLRSLTPQAEALDLRVRCGANLQDLWYRLQSFHRLHKSWFGRSAASFDVVYPRSTEWCDAIVRAYGNARSNEMAPKLFKCPSAGEGKCHYAMNPNCRSDSPPNVVLLFETKAGWNQHGGPELFTFDNHDPRGGLVLLNDSTVKFIRTEEELKQLRWK
jgi:hypothetical protein